MSIPPSVRRSHSLSSSDFNIFNGKPLPQPIPKTTSHGVSSSAKVNGTSHRAPDLVKGPLAPPPSREKTTKVSSQVFDSSSQPNGFVPSNGFYFDNPVSTPLSRRSSFSASNGALNHYPLQNSDRRLTLDPYSRNSGSSFDSQVSVSSQRTTQLSHQIFPSSVQPLNSFTRQYGSVGGVSASCPSTPRHYQDSNESISSIDSSHFQKSSSFSRSTILPSVGSSSSGENQDNRRAIEDHVSRASVAASKYFMTLEQAAQIPQEIEDPQLTMNRLQSSSAQGETCVIDHKMEQGYLFGMLDGYKGNQIAQKAMAFICDKFSSKLTAAKNNPIEAFNTLFQELNAEISHSPNKDKTGTRVLLCFIPTGNTTNQIFTATLGDARAYLYRQVGGATKVMPLSPICDWKGKGENAEAKRVERLPEKNKVMEKGKDRIEAISISNCRVGFSRALGIECLGFLERKPFITQNDFNPSKDIFVLACANMSEVLLQLNPEDVDFENLPKGIDANLKHSMVVIKHPSLVQRAHSFHESIEIPRSPNSFPYYKEEGLISPSHFDSFSASSRFPPSDLPPASSPLKSDPFTQVDSGQASSSLESPLLQTKVDEQETKIKTLEKELEELKSWKITIKEDLEGKIKSLEEQVEELKKGKSTEETTSDSTGGATADQLKTLKEEAIEEVKNSIGIFSLLTAAWESCLASVQRFFRYLLGIEPTSTGDV